MALFGSGTHQGRSNVTSFRVATGTPYQVINFERISAIEITKTVFSIPTAQNPIRRQYENAIVLVKNETYINE